MCKLINKTVASIDSSDKICYNVLYLNKEEQMELTKRMKDLTGQKKGRLTAIRPSHRDKQNSVMWEFKCECGNTHIARGADFSIGKQQSCGCLQEENRFSHNMSNTRTYKIWRSMKSRCHESTRASDVENYQNRNITVCDEWKDSFEKFYEDMGEAKDGFDIDRIDNNKGYSKYNCRWISRKENLQNRRNSYIWCYNDKEYGSAQDLAEVVGVTAGTIDRWVNGYTHNQTGKYYPPKEGYSRRLKYEREVE